MCRKRVVVVHVQPAIDDLAHRVGRPVLLEDHAQRVLAYSEQNGPMDEVRRDSILRRHTEHTVRALFRAAGIFEARGPLRIPGADAVLPRVCVPVRHRDRLLGFLWLIDEPVLPPVDLDLVAKSADELALALLHDSLAAGLSAQRELDAVSEVLLGDARAGAGVLLGEGGFPPLPVTVLVVRGALARDELEQGLLAVRLRVTARHLLREDHGVLVCTGRVPVADLPALFPGPVSVGVGERRPSLAEAGAAYAEALHAAAVAARVPEFGPVASWASLGVYQLLRHIPADALHPGVAELLSVREHAALAQTLETYLDLAGNVAATAKALRLHRTSLYYRLQRVEAVTGTSLKNGHDRLLLHLHLKLARFTGADRV